MRRSSWIILALAVLILLGLGFLYVHSLDRSAPAMTPRVAADILNRGKAAVDRRDVDGIMALTAPDARILGLRPEQARLAIGQAMRQMGPTRVQIGWKNLNVRQEGDVAYVSFDLDMGEKTGDMVTSYLQDRRVSVQFEKTRTRHWGGLYTTEDWKATQIDGDVPLDAVSD